MIKGVFTSGLPKEGVEILKNLQANALFINSSKLAQLPFRSLIKNKIKIFTEISLFVGEDWWKKYPDSRPVNRKGELMEKINWYAGVCPNHPKIRREKLQYIKEVIEEYPISGVWLDFIRYPCHWEKVRDSKIIEYCFCQNCLKKFQKEVGGKPKGRKWVQWKCDQVTSFVTDTYTLINQSGKKIKLGIFSVPWRKEDFSGAIKKIIGQDFKSLAKYVDIFSPMVYHRICNKKLEWISQMVKYMAKTTKKGVLPIIQVADFPEDKKDKMSAEELQRAIREASLPPSSGFILFTLDRLIQAREMKKLHFPLYL